MDKSALAAQYKGTKIQELSTPCAILDLAKLEVNCQRMLDTVRRLDLGWRPHIKTHKTLELTRLQVGNDKSTPAQVIVSTILEAENLVPLAREYQSQGRSFNVLYGFPLYPSAVQRFSTLLKTLGEGSLSLMIDHPSQLDHVDAIFHQSGHKPQVFMKVDMGYRRAGVIPGTDPCPELVDAILKHESTGTLSFLGIYAHAGQSYQAREDWKALDYLIAEFKSLEEVAGVISEKAPGHPLVLSVGASPTATALQHPSIGSAASSSGHDANEAVEKVNAYLEGLKEKNYSIEVHAGVYPVLDLQQLATHARSPAFLTSDSLALTILVEVASLYESRGPSGTVEALINAGCLALGREPCADMGEEKGKHYNGFGVLMPWDGLDNEVPGPEFPAKHGGWQVGKVSQEHGILRWQGDPKDLVPLQFGQKVRVWPNHACVAGAGFDKYFIVDSRREGHADEIVDVWPRWNGW